MMETYINDLTPDTRRKMAILALAGWKFSVRENHVTNHTQPWFFVRHPISNEIMIGDGDPTLAGAVLNRWVRSQCTVLK
jgi:hypothetical protein